MVDELDLDIDNLYDKQGVPTRGSLLISSPLVGDTLFMRSVVAMVDNDSEGSMGLIVNRLLPQTLKDVMPDWLGDNDFPLFIGGPLHVDSLFFIHTFPVEVIKDSIQLKQGLYFGGNEDDLRSVIKLLPPYCNRLRFFLGYSGWMPGQLAGEIENGDWAVTRNYHPDTVMTEDYEMWDKVIDIFGERYRHWHEWPYSPSNN
ncbi:MAG: YqgE/AlgH family protein [Muribaculaceae bacterium]|nr:YqgE/AlgH family protein [Muribaculaceae bacterium]